VTPWEPIHNPYIVGNPIKGAKLFFGREDDFAFIKTKFAGGKEGGLIVLCGARRSGKTSILFQILDGRLGADFLPVLVDMQSMAIVNDRQFVRRLLELIEAAAAEAGVSPGSAEFTDSPFADVEAYVSRLARSLGPRKLILAFDEYELIETGIDSGAISTQVLHTLANLIEHRQVFVVFTGSEKLEERSKKYWDIFLSKALHRRISFLSRDDTLRLIREPVEGAIEYAGGVPERIYDLTAGQPFYTQVICQSLVDHLNDERKRRVDMEDVERAVEEVVQNPLPQMIFHWNALADLQKLSLAIMAELTRKERRAVTAAQILEFGRSEKLGYEIDANALNKTLDRLFHGDLAQRDPKGETFEFKMDLWRLWAMRMHSVWQVIGEIDQGGGPAAGSGIARQKPAVAGRRRVWYAAAAVVLLATAGYVARDAMQGGRGETREAGVTGSRAPVEHAGTVVITTTPPGADIRIDDVPYGRSPVTTPLSAGEHAVHGTRDGYADLADSVVVAEGETTSVNLVLVELTGAVVVETRPPGGRVVLDDGAARPSPATWKDVAVGSPHRVVVSLDGYASASYEVRAVADSTIRIVHAFSRQTAPLAISSRPPGAAVTMDGQTMGTTPFAAAAVNHGPHDVHLSLAGYREWSGRIEVPVANNLVEITLARLEPGVIVFSITPYADVYVDGKRVAQSVPFFRVEADAGKHTVELRHPQYKSFSREIDLEPGGTQRVEHTFTE